MKIKYIDFNFNNALDIEKEITRLKSNENNIQREQLVFQFSQVKFAQIAV